MIKKVCIACPSFPASRHFRSPSPGGDAEDSARIRDNLTEKMWNLPTHLRSLQCFTCRSGWFANRRWDFNYSSRNGDSNGKEPALNQQNWSIQARKIRMSKFIKQPPFPGRFTPDACYPIVFSNLVPIWWSIRSGIIKLMGQPLLIVQDHDWTKHSILSFTV